MKDVEKNLIKDKLRQLFILCAGIFFIFVCVNMTISKEISNIDDNRMINSQEVDYFPLTIGSSWVYKTNIGKATVTVLQDKENPEYIIKNLKVSILSIDEVLYKKNNEVICPERGIKAIIVKRNIVFEPDLVRLRMPLEVGDTWKCDGIKTIDNKSQFQKSTMTVVATESIVVPAGKFSCIKVKQESSDEDGSKECFYQWLAPGVGQVRMEGTFEMKGVLAIIQKILGIEVIEMELVEYDIK